MWETEGGIKYRHNERPEKPKLQNMGFCIEHQTFYFYNSENRREKGVVEGVRQR